MFLQGPYICLHPEFVSHYKLSSDTSQSRTTSSLGLINSPNMMVGHTYTCEVTCTGRDVVPAAAAQRSLFVNPYALRNRIGHKISPHSVSSETAHSPPPLILCSISAERLPHSSTPFLVTVISSIQYSKPLNANGVLYLTMVFCVKSQSAKYGIRKKHMMFCDLHSVHLYVRSFLKEGM